ncbi:MAG: hypothetical protein WDM81_04460 [Rhizomicrobium sp.]
MAELHRRHPKQRRPGFRRRRPRQRADDVQQDAVQNAFEYGLTNYLTVFATPAYVVAKVATLTVPLTHADNTSVEVGARAMLFAHIGKLSLQGSYKTAGLVRPLGLGRARIRPPDRAAPALRHEFSLFGKSGFFDAQVAQALDRPSAPERDADRPHRGALADEGHDAHGAELQHRQRRRRPAALRLLPQPQDRAVDRRKAVAALAAAIGRLLLARGPECPGREGASASCCGRRISARATAPAARS